VGEIYFYKMTVDNGGAPCVDRNLLSLAICKLRIRSAASRGALIFGFGANKQPMANRLIYIAKVTDDPLTDGKYYDEYRSRGDCIYNRTKNGKLIWRKGSKFHKNGSEAYRDIGSSPDYKKATVLLSRDFRYFGDKGLADYGDDFPIIRRAVKELGRSHRVYHRAVLRNQFLDLKSKIWRKYKRMRIGEPTHKDTTKRCNGGGGGICTL
jgi:hypothetical protein